MPENEIASLVIGASIEIHKQLGPGLLESVYERALFYELENLGFIVEQQVPVALVYKDERIDYGYRIDILVERKVVVEIKSVVAIAPVHFSQVLTYIRLSNYKLGLLINFNVHRLKEGIHRVVNNL